MDCEIRAFPSLFFSLSLSFSLVFFCGSGESVSTQVKCCDSKNRAKGCRASVVFISNCRTCLPFLSYLKTLGGFNQPLVVTEMNIYRLLMKTNQSRALIFRSVLSMMQLCCFAKRPQAAVEGIF